MDVAHNSSFGPQEMINVRNDKVYILQTLSKSINQHHQAMNKQNIHYNINLFLCRVPSWMFNNIIIRMFFVLYKFAYVKNKHGGKL
jgi:hypothetical protein